MLCVMGKSSSKIRAVMSLARVLFLTVTQQQMMQKLQNRPHMKSSFWLAKWQSRKLNTVFLLWDPWFLWISVYCLSLVPYISGLCHSSGIFILFMEPMCCPELLWAPGLTFFVYFFENVCFCVPAVLFLWAFLRNRGFCVGHWMGDLVQKKKLYDVFKW